MGRDFRHFGIFIIEKGHPDKGYLLAGSGIKEFNKDLSEDIKIMNGVPKLITDEIDITGDKMNEEEIEKAERQRKDQNQRKDLFHFEDGKKKYFVSKIERPEKNIYHKIPVEELSKDKKVEAVVRYVVEVGTKVKKELDVVSDKYKGTKTDLDYIKGHIRTKENKDMIRLNDGKKPLINLKYGKFDESFAEDDSYAIRRNVSDERGEAIAEYYKFSPISKQEK